MHDPNLQTLRKAARVTVVATLCFTLGEYVLHDSQLTVLATFTAIALVGIADFGGSARGRVTANLAATVAGLALVSTGTWVSETTWTAGLAMFLVVFVVSFSGVYSGYFAAGTTAVILFYVVSSGVPAPPSAIPSRLEGVALAGALATAAAVWLWPLYGRTAVRGRLSTSLGDLGRLISAVSSDRPVPSEEIDRRRRAAADGALAARTALAAMADQRAGGPTSPDKAQIYLMHGIDRMNDLVGRLIDHPPPSSLQSSRPLMGAWRELLATLTETLDRCAASLVDRAAAPDLDTVVAARDRFRATAEERLTEMLASDPDRSFFASKVERTVLSEELATAVLVAAAHTRVAVGADKVIGAEVVGPANLRPIAPEEGPAWAKWARRARCNLTLDSIHLRNSLRLAAGLTLARVAVGALDLQHGFWVVFATLTVLKTTATTTRITALQAVAGTLIGFGLSAALATAFHGNGLAYSATLPVIIFIAYYTAGVVNFVVGQAAFTVLIVVLFNILEPLGWRVGLVRLEDVVAGAAIGLAIGLAIWPRGAVGQLRKTLAELLDAGRAYNSVRARSLLRGVAEPSGCTDLRYAAIVAAIQSEDVFAQCLAERKQGAAALRSWADILVAGHRLWYSADVMATLPVPAGTPSRCADLVAALDEGIDTMAGGYGKVADALRSRGPVGQSELLVGGARHLGPQSTVCAERMAGCTKALELTLAVRLFELRAWLTELSDDLRRLEGLVSSLAKPTPPAAARAGVTPAPAADGSALPAAQG